MEDDGNWYFQFIWVKAPLVTQWSFTSMTGISRRLEIFYSSRNEYGRTSTVSAGPVSFSGRMISSCVDNVETFYMDDIFILSHSISKGK